MISEVLHTIFEKCVFGFNSYSPDMNEWCNFSICTSDSGPCNDVLESSCLMGTVL